MQAGRGAGITRVIPLVVVFGTLGSGLFGAGMRAVQEREANILRRYKVAPISPLPLLVASTVPGLIVYIPFFILMLILSKTLYGMQIPANTSTVVLFIMVGVNAIRSI